MILEEGTDEQLKECAEQACLPKSGERWGWLGVDLRSTWTLFNVLAVADGWVYTNEECSDISVGRWLELYAQQRLKRWDHYHHKTGRTEAQWMKIVATHKEVCHRERYGS